MKRLNFDFKVKKVGKGGITTIAGLANANTVDRMKERIVPNAWNLDNYKKNPVVLFDHGHDPTFGFMPIGKATKVEPTEEGLYTEIEISSSKSEKISAIRDLVEEGILKTFSVGFDPKESTKSAENPDIIEITKAELIETSIVPIPMNQDSTFTMLRKRKAAWHTPLAKKWYDTFLDRVEVIKKKAWAAAAVQQRLDDLVEVGEIRDRQAALRFVADESGENLHNVKKALAGDIQIPPTMLKAFATVLRIDPKLLQQLNTGKDVALLERFMSRDEEPNGGDIVAKKKKSEKMGEAAMTPPEGQKPKDEQKPAKKDAMGVICYVAVPKTSADSAEAAASAVEAAGYAVDQAEETAEAYVFWQVPKDSVDTSVEGLTVDLGDGVYAHVAPTSGGQPEEEAPAPAPAAEAPKAGDSEEAKADPAPMTPEEEAAAKDAYAKFQEERKATNEGGAGNPAAWIADEDKWNKAKEMAKAAGADDIYAFAVWAYLNVLGGTKKSGGAPYVKNIDGTDDNPYLELSRAGNATLGAILNELKGMSEKLDGMADLSVALSKAAGEAKGDVPPTDTSTEGKDGDLVKSLDSLRGYQRDLDKKLKHIFKV